LKVAVWAMMNGVDCQCCTDSLKRVRGCDGGVSLFIDGESIDRCPGRYLTHSIMGVLQCVRHYKNGFLPYPGTWLEQPSKLVQAIDFVDSTIERISKEKEDGETRYQHQHQR